MYRQIALILIVLGSAALAAPALAAPLEVTLVAGSGAYGHGGDGGPATAAQLSRPISLDLTPGGRLLVADQGEPTDHLGRLREISPGGTITTGAAPGGGSPVGDEFLPLAVSAADGNGYVAGDDVLDALYVKGSGGLVRIAGGDADDHDPEEPDTDPGGEGGHCDADFRLADVAYHGPRFDGLGMSASFLLVDTFTNQDPWPDGRPSRVLFLDPGSTGSGCSIYALSRVAGGGPGPPPATSIAPSGEGQSATGVYMNAITSIDSLHGHGGGFLVATAGEGDGPLDCRVRRVSSGGVVSLAAGTGVCAMGPGEDVPAAASPIDRPSDVVATPDGGLLILEGRPFDPVDGPGGMTRIRRVSPQGRISTIEAHNPYGGIGLGPAHVPFPAALALAALPDGDFLVASRGLTAGEGGRVVRVDANFGAGPPPGGPSGPGPGPGAPNPTPPKPQPRPGAKAKPPKLTLARSVYTVRRGRKLAIRFRSSAAGTVRLDLQAGKKRRLRRNAKARKGANRIVLPARLAPRRYRLVLRLRAGGEVAIARATVKVRPAATHRRHRR